MEVECPYGSDAVISTSYSPTTRSVALVSRPVEEMAKLMSQGELSYSLGGAS